MGHDNKLRILHKWLLLQLILQRGVMKFTNKVENRCDSDKNTELDIQ